MTKYAVRIVDEPSPAPWLSFANDCGLRKFSVESDRAIFLSREAAVNAILKLPAAVRSLLDLEIVPLEPVYSRSR